MSPETATAHGSARRIAGRSEPRYSQSLERGLAILAAFTAKRPVLGIADIADGLGLSRSTTHRYAATLVALGYLEQTASRKYRLGLRVADLGAAALHSTSLYEHAHVYLVQLCRDISHTVGLGVLDGGDVLYIDRVRSYRRGWNEVDSNLQPGSRVPVYCTAMGKLLLANLAEVEQQELIAGLRLSKRASHTITSKKALREELVTVRASGIAISDRELVTDMVAVAVPVRGEAGEVLAAVNLVARSSETSSRELAESLSPQLRVTAEKISARLGYRREDEPRGGAGERERSGRRRGLAK